MKIKTGSELGRKSVEEFRNAEKFPVTIVLDNVRSMHNVGSVFRSSDAFLVNAIVLCGFTPRPPHRDIQKTALGATETVNWQYIESAVEAVTALRREGWRVYAVEQVEKSIPLYEFSFATEGKIALVFGNELTGVSPEVLAICDGSVEIPQFGMKHSLNISVAAGIVLWELIGRRSLSR